MPFEKVDIQKRIEEKMKIDIEFKKAYEEVQKEKKLIRKITEIRRQKGLTQKQIADMTGMKQQALSRMEKERHAPTLNNLFKILSALDLDIKLVKKGRME